MPEENVTTKFKVDISDLKKSISEANKDIKLYKAELANASAGMKKGTESADSLTKKIEAQSKIVEAEKAKLQALKDELARYESKISDGAKTVDNLTRRHEEAAKAFGADSEQAQALAKQLEKAQAAQERNVTAAENLRLKIIQQDTAVKNAEGQVQNYSSALTDLQKGEDKADDSTDKLGKSFEESGKDAEKATSGGLSAFTVALGNLASNAITSAIKKLEELGKAAVDAFEDFDAGRDALIKATGATGEAADELTAVYSATAKTIGGDLETVGALIGEVNTRFGYTGEKLSEVSADFAKFSDITGMDAVSAVQAVSKALAGAGMDAEDYSELLDKLAAASQASGISSDTLAAGLQKYGAQMRSIGYSTDDTIALLSQFEKSGVNAETALKGLQTASISWTKEGKNAKDELSAVIREIEKMPNSTDAAQKAIEVFGKKAGLELSDVIRSGRFEFSEFADVVAGSAGTVNSTFEETQSGIDKIKIAAQGLSVTFGEAAGKLVEGFAPGIENIIKLFTDVISGDDEAEDELADAIGGFVETALDKAVGALPAAVGFVTRLVGKLVGALAEAAPDVVSGIGVAIRTVINGLTGFLPNLIDSVLMAIPEVCNALLEAAPQVIKATLTLAERVAKKIPEAITKLTEYLPLLVQGVSDFLVTQTPVIVQSAIGIVTGLVQALPTVIQALVDALPRIFKTLTGSFSDYAPMILQACLDLVSMLVESAPELAKTIYPMIPQIMDTLVESVMNFIPVWIETLSIIFDMVASAIPGLWENVKQAFSKVFEMWKTNIFDRARDAFTELWDIIKEKATTIGTFIGDTVGGAFKTAINAVLETMENNLNFAPRAINKAIDAINKLPGVSIDPIPEIELPRLEKGAIIDRETVATVGENGKEAIIPLEKNKAGIREIAQVLRDEMNDVKYGSTGVGSHVQTGTTVNMTQNISSPKALSAYEVWRQTQNMINLIKVQGV